MLNIVKKPHIIMKMFRYDVKIYEVKIPWRLNELQKQVVLKKETKVKLRCCKCIKN